MRLVEVGDVPGGGLDPDAVEDAARGLRADAGAVRDCGREVAGAWAGLGASYEAPEAGALLRVMDPVRADTDRLGDELERVAAALARFAGELREIVARRDRLRVEVRELRARVAAAPVGGAADVGAGSGLGGAGLGATSGVGLDPVLATENGLLVGRIAALVEDLAEAERACAAAVRSIDGWQERAGGFLLDTARGVVSDRLPWGEPGGAESCVGAAAEQVFAGVWNGVSFPAFLAAQPLLARLGGPGVSPAAQQAAWAEAGRSLIGWGVAQGEDLAGEIVAGFEPVAAWAEETTADVVGWSADQVDALWLTGKDAVRWTGDRVQDASDWVGHTRRDIATWMAGPGTEIADDWANFGDATLQLYGALNRFALSGEVPRVTEVVASVVLAGGALYGAIGTTANGGTDPYNFFDDGEPMPTRTAEGLPIPGMVVTAGEDGHPDGVAPEGVSQLLESVTDAYRAGQASGGNEGYIRVTTLEREPGLPPRVIVSIPGTQAWDPPTGAVAADLTGNFVTAGGGRSTITEAVASAISDKGNVPADAQIMLVGHSQGGMTAADLASDPDFVRNHNVTNVVTFGSPIDSSHIDPAVEVLELQHATDIVSRLDLEDMNLLDMGALRFVEDNLDRAREGLGRVRSLFTDDASGGHTVITMPNPGSWDEVGTNHSHVEYRESVQSMMNSEGAEGSRGRELADYQESIERAGFLTGERSRIRVQDLQVGRKD